MRGNELSRNMAASGDVISKCREPLACHKPKAQLVFRKQLQSLLARERRIRIGSRKCYPDPLRRLDLQRQPFRG